MKLFFASAIWAVLCCASHKTNAIEAIKDPFAHIMQEKVRIDLDSSTILYNGEVTTPELLKEKVKDAYSIDLSANSSKTLAASPELLKSTLECIAAADIPADRVRLNLIMKPKLSANRYLNAQVTSADLTEMEKFLSIQEHKGMPPVMLSAKDQYHTADYKLLLEFLQLLPPDTKLAGLKLTDANRVKITAAIYQMNENGERDVLSAPMQTVLPGESSTIRVVENRTGRQYYSPEDDLYHQEDLANLGVRSTFAPQIIGEHIRVSGVVILTKAMDIGGVFRLKDGPVTSYSCTKVVIPFSIVLEPDTESVDIAVADIDGKETRCKISAIIVDDKGMSRKEREMMRAIRMQQP